MTQVFHLSLVSPITSTKQMNLGVPHHSFLRAGSYALNAQSRFFANLCALCLS